MTRIKFFCISIFLFVALFYTTNYTQIKTNEDFTDLTRYYPLEIGNTFQFMKRRILSGGPPYTLLYKYEINKDSTFNGQKYYHMIERSGSIFWCRIDSTGKLFRYLSNDVLYMDFGLPSGTKFNGKTIYKDTVNIYGINTIRVRRGDEIWAYNLGQLYEYYEYYEFADYNKEYEELIQFMDVKDGKKQLFKQPYYPEFEINNLSADIYFLNVELKVNHVYSKFYSGYYLTELSFNYIDSVKLEGFYQKGDITINVLPVLLSNLQYTPNYSLSYPLEFELIYNGFKFFYKFSTKDKGMVPQYSFYPDSGYLQIEINEVSPNAFEISQNYPNPFNIKTKIEFKIPQNTFISIKVYDLLGNLVSSLIDEEKLAGIHEIEFDASNLASGIYYYQMRAGDFTETKKMILLK